MLGIVKDVLGAALRELGVVTEAVFIPDLNAT